MMINPTNTSLDWYTKLTTASAWGIPTFNSTAITLRGFMTQDKPYLRAAKAVEDQNDRLCVFGQDSGFIKGDRFIVNSVTYETTNISKDSDINGQIWNVTLTLKEVSV